MLEYPESLNDSLFSKLQVHYIITDGSTLRMLVGSSEEIVLQRGPCFPQSSKAGCLLAGAQSPEMPPAAP